MAYMQLSVHETMLASGAANTLFLYTTAVGACLLIARKDRRSYTFVLRAHPAVAATLVSDGRAL